MQALFCVKSSIIFPSFLTCSSGSLNINPSAKWDFLQLSYTGSNIVIIGKNGKFKSLNSYNFNIMVRANLSFGKQIYNTKIECSLNLAGDEQQTWKTDIRYFYDNFYWDYFNNHLMFHSTLRIHYDLFNPWDKKCQILTSAFVLPFLLIRLHKSVSISGRKNIWWTKDSIFLT